MQQSPFKEGASSKEYQRKVSSKKSPPETLAETPLWAESGDPEMDLPLTDCTEAVYLFKDTEIGGEEEPLGSLSEEGGDDELRSYIQQYMRKAGRTPLLTEQQERQIALRIEEAKKELESAGLTLPFATEELCRILSRPDRLPDRVHELDRKGECQTHIPTSELNQLLDRLKKAHEQYVAARNEFAEANLRLVISIAKRYVDRGLSFPDLVQEGNVGLMKAAEKFDWRMGHRFSTYAVWWIKQAMRRAIKEQTRTIHIPAHAMEAAQRVAHLSHKLSQDLGREPLATEIAAEMGIPAEKIREILHMIHEPVSLETPVGDEGRLIEMIEDKCASGFQEGVLFRDLAEGLDKALSSLTEREEKLIRMRFGLGDESHQHTLEEVAQTFGLTRERVRQIEAKALKKLRCHAKALKE